MEIEKKRSFVTRTGTGTGYRQTDTMGVAASARAGSRSSAPEATVRHFPPAEVDADPQLTLLAKKCARERRPEAYDDHYCAWRANDGAALEDLLAEDLDLRESPVRLVDARFIIALAKAGRRLARRQDMPDAAFLPAAPVGYRF